MDRDRFDALARLLASKGSRRGTLGALLGGALLGWEPDALAKPKTKKKKGGKPDGKKGKRRKKRRGGESAPLGQDPVASSPTNCCGTERCGPPGAGTHHDECDYAGQSFAGGHHQGSHFSRIDGRGTNFNDSDTSGALFEEACLQGASFRNADLRGTVFADACLVDADLRGADLGSDDPELHDAILCRTRMPNGSLNNRDCGIASSCCATCRGVGASCGGEGGGAACCEGFRCLAGECVPLLGRDDCPVEVCQFGSRNQQGTCVYTNSPDNQQGPACRISGRFCCDGSCCRPGDVCLESGCCTPQPLSQTCDGRCDAVTDNCGQTVQCGDCAVRACQIAGCDQTTCLYADSPDNAPGPQCPDPFFCCRGQCCRQGDVCTATGCCTPDSPQPCQGRCGTFTDNCGRQFNCGDCPQVLCQTVTCNPQTHVCDHVTHPNRTQCVNADRRIGICCNGTCIVNGQCCAVADCEPVVPCRPFLCQGNQCVLSGPEPDRTVCQGQFGTGICCGGFCFSDSNNQVCCATSDCPPLICRITACSDNICQPDLFTPENQPGPGCSGTGEFCCAGNCCRSGQQCVNGACAGP